MNGDQYKKAYQTHKYNCNGKTDVDGNPVEMRLSFDEWLAIWNASGHLAQRGRGKDKYVMSRIDDRGHYESGNVEVITHAENVRRASLNPNRRVGVRVWTEAALDEARSGSAQRYATSVLGEDVTCPHCGETGRYMPMQRWHFDNCGKKPTITCPHCGTTGTNAGPMARHHFDNCKGIRARVAKNPDPIVTCPHCNAQGGKRGMGRWHFDNCKHKT